MQRKFERRAAAVLAVFALSFTALAHPGFAQTRPGAAPAQPATQDAVVTQMAAKMPPPEVAASTSAPTQPASAPSASTAPPPPAPPPATPRQTASAQVIAPAAPVDVGADYVLGSADKIRLTVFGEPSLTGEYFVSSSGVVSLPLAGDVQATGLTLRDFHDRVVKVLQDGYLKDPKVSLEVLTFRPFYILGEVSKPGQYPYTSGLTVFNAVATAGGFTYRANTHKVLIKRATETAEHEVTLSSETTIAPGDTIRIPERFF